MGKHSGLSLNGHSFEIAHTIRSFWNWPSLRMETLYPFQEQRSLYMTKK